MYFEKSNLVNGCVAVKFFLMPCVYIYDINIF